MTIMRRRALDAAGPLFGVLIISTLMWFGGAGMLRAIANASLLPQLGALGVGMLTYVVAARRWQAVTNSLCGRPVATFREFLRARVITGSVGFLMPRELAESGGRALWLTRFRMVPGLIAVQSIVIDRLCDLLFALLALLPTLALVAGFTSAPMATLLTGLGCVAVVGIGPIALRPLIAGSGPAFGYMAARLSRYPIMNKLIGSVSRLGEINQSTWYRLLALSCFKYALLIGRVVLVGSAGTLGVDGWHLAAFNSLGQAGYAIGVTPGGLGVFEAGWYGILRTISDDTPQIIAFVILLRINTLLSLCMWLPFCLYFGGARPDGRTQMQT